MAKLFVCSFLFVLAACAGNASAEAIRGGSSTSIGARPYLASLQTKNGNRVCGGALINKNTLLTAASCLAFYDVSQLVVGVKNGAQTVKIASSRFSPKYDPITNANDVAIVKLAKPVSIGTIALATSEPSNGASGDHLGWGSGNNVVDVNVSILSAKACGSGAYSYSSDDIDNSMLCSLAKNKNACGGLAGDPVIANNKVVGVVSGGYGCGNKGNPATLANVAKLRSWINQAAK